MCGSVHWRTLIRKNLQFQLSELLVFVKSRWRTEYIYLDATNWMCIRIYVVENSTAKIATEYSFNSLSYAVSCLCLCRSIKRLDHNYDVSCPLFLPPSVPRSQRSPIPVGTLVPRPERCLLFMATQVPSFAIFQLCPSFPVALSCRVILVLFDC